MGTLMREDNLFLAEATFLHPKLREFLDGIDDEEAGFLKYCDPSTLHQYCDSVMSDVFRITSGWRTFSAQHELYERSRQPGAAVVTEVDAGDSFHNWGLAVDLIFTRFGYDNGYYKGKEYKGANYGNIYIDTGLVRYAKSLGLRWGGDNTGLVDSAHFEFGILPPPNMRQESLARPKWWENKTIFDDGADWEYMNGKRSAASVSALLDSPASSSGSFLSGVKGVFIAAGVAVVGYMVYKTFIKKG